MPQKKTLFIVVLLAHFFGYENSVLSDDGFPQSQRTSIVLIGDSQLGASQ